MLHRTSVVAAELVAAEQVYNCLWSHAGGVPGHIHYVVQPVTRDLLERHAEHGPMLQVAMFNEGEAPADDVIEEVADRARAAFARSRA